MYIIRKSLERQRSKNAHFNILEYQHSNTNARTQVREVKEWRDTGVCINMKHTKRRIKYLVAKSVALLSLGSASSGGENSWSSVISSLDDEDKNVMILRFLERGATRTCFRWRAMLRAELKSDDYGSSSTFSASSSSSSSSSASSNKTCEDNDQDDFGEISGDQNSGFCCGGSSSSTNDKGLSDEILLENSTSLKRCDSMCLVAMINLITSCTWCSWVRAFLIHLLQRTHSIVSLTRNYTTRMSRKHSTHASHSNTGTESSLLRSNLTSRLSRARKLFEINLEQTDIPKLMYKKRTERSTKHSEEEMYNLLFTGIEVLFSNEKQNESVRARVRGV